MPRVLNTIMHPTRGRLVCRIWDLPSVNDRYTVALKAKRSGRATCYPYLACSENPTHPQGFGQHGESDIFITGKFFGKRVSFDSLPPAVQDFILRNI